MSKNQVSTPTAAAAAPILTQDQLGVNQLSDECSNPRKFQIDHDVALREKEYRHIQKEKVIDKLAEMEFNLKMNGTGSLTEFELRMKKELIEKTKETLVKLYEFEEKDELRELTYEYFKVINFKEAPRQQNGFRLFEVEDGDGIVLEFDFYEIYTTNRNAQKTMDYPTSECNKFNYRGEIMAIGKDANNFIRKVRHLEYLPSHLVNEQKICELFEGDEEDESEDQEHFAHATAELTQIIEVEVAVVDEDH